MNPYEPKRTALLIVPNYVYEEINRRLDAAIALAPDAALDREYLYNALLGAYDEFGFIPKFELERKP
jgi:hypothetical protein